MNENMITDSAFLEFAEGVHSNSLINILDMKKLSDDIITTEPLVILQSSYYDYDKFNLANANQKRLSILSSNIQSINTKCDELNAYVTYLSTINFKFSVICLQESCISDNDDLSLILGMTIIMTINTYEHWEGQLIQVTGGGLTHAATIVNVYRPPRPSRENYQNLIDELSNVISIIKQKRKKNIILAGDFNILKINEQNFAATSLTLHTFSLFPQITLPTRFSVRNVTLLNIVCELNASTLQSTSGTLINKLSGHQPYFLIIDKTFLNLFALTTSPWKPC